MNSTGVVVKIWIKRFARGPMDGREDARLIEGRGLEGNANQGGKRQVTLLDLDAWRAMQKEIGREIDPAARRANLLVMGVNLENSGGRVVRIGSTRLQLHGETRPCERMDEALQGMRAAMDPDWRGGAYGEVLEGGTICVGDQVQWEDGESAAGDPA